MTEIPELEQQLRRWREAAEAAHEEITTLKADLAQARKERDEFRIEADECLHRVDDVELALAAAREAFEKRRVEAFNQSGDTYSNGFDPYAAEADTWQEAIDLLAGKDVEIPDEATQEGERAENPNYVEGRDFDKATEDHLTEASDKRAIDIATRELIEFFETPHNVWKPEGIKMEYYCYRIPMWEKAFAKFRKHDERSNH